MSSAKRLVLEVEDCGQGSSFPNIRVCASVLNEEGAGHGHRICGPKATYAGRRLKEVALDQRDRDALRAMLAEVDPQPSPGRWWICTGWLTPHDEKDAPGVKIAGPFRDQNEALENRARIENYTGGRTFYVDEETGQ